MSENLFKPKRLPNIRSKHVEEGIRNFANCVECHRRADEDDIRGGEGRDGVDDDD